MGRKAGPDAIVIGAGIIGTAIALELSRRGLRTLNVDRHPAAGYGPTSSSCAIVRAHYSSFEGVALAHEGMQYWLNWSDYVEPDGELAATYHDTGTLWIVRSGGGQERILSLYDTVGVEYEVLDVEETKRRYPFLDTHSYWPPRRPDDPHFYDPSDALIEGAIFTPGSGFVNDPHLATRDIQFAAERHGARFLFNTEVKSIKRRSDRVVGVTLSTGTDIESPIVINVAGPHSAIINRMACVEAGMRVKTRPLRHEVHILPAPSEFSIGQVGCHISDADLAIYMRPAAGNNLLVGSEDPECDSRIWIDNPDDYDRQVTKEQWEAQVFRCARRMPSLRIPIQPRGIVDLYDCSDDWVPIYDRSDLDGFYMAIGTSGNQFKNAPVAAQVMADIIEACEAGHDHDANGLEIELRRTKKAINARFYSRLRELNPDSSFSVMG